MVVAAFAFGVRLGREPLWLDESYSYAMVQHGFFDIVRLTRGDVHPPLYYFTLKLAAALIGSSPTALRVPSVVAALGLVALGMGPIRRIWGERTGFVYAWVVVLSPGILCFAQEARMYTLAAFLVTGAVLYGHLSLVGSSRSDNVWFAVFTWAAAMTHYFGLIAAAANALVVLAATFFRSRARLRAVSLAVLGAGLAYSPWLMAFWSQVAAVSRGFWIPPTSATLLTFGLVAPFTYKFEDVPYPWQALVALAMGATTIVLGFAVRTWRAARGHLLAHLHLLVVFALTLVSSLGFSKLVQPVFMPRYMMVCSGLLLLAFATAISRPRQLGYSVLLTCILVALGLPAWLRIQFTTFNGPFADLAQQIRESKDPAPVLLHNDAQAYYPSWHAVSEGRHVIATAKGTSFDPTVKGVYGGHRLASTDDLTTVLDGVERVWLVDADPSGFHVESARIVSYPGWHQVGPKLRLEHPMSWVKLSLTRFERTP